MRVAHIAAVTEMPEREGRERRSQGGGRPETWPAYILGILLWFLPHSFRLVRASFLPCSSLSAQHPPRLFEEKRSRNKSHDTTIFPTLCRMRNADHATSGKIHTM